MSRRVGPMVLGAVCLWVPSSGAEAPSDASQVRSCLGPEPTSGSTWVRQGCERRAGSQSSCVCTGAAPGTRLPRVPAWGRCHSGSAPLHTWGALLWFQAEPQPPGPAQRGRGCPRALQPYTLFHAPFMGQCPPRPEALTPAQRVQEEGWTQDTKGPQSHTLASGAGQGAGSRCPETSPLPRKIRTGEGAERTSAPSRSQAQSYRPRGTALWGEGCLGKGSAKGGGSLSHTGE